MVGPIDDDYYKHRKEFETVAKDFRGKVKTTFSFPNRNALLSI